MKYQTAATILTQHGMQHGESTQPGMIWALNIWTCSDGGAVVLGETWEEIEMTRPSIYAWLGY